MKTAEINKYKDQLLELRDRLSAEVGHMIDSVPENMTAPGDISHVPTHNADHDSEGLDKEVALIRNEEGILEAVELALIRIEEGTFGQCLECRGDIAKARIDALPYTPRCIECAQRFESMEPDESTGME